MLDELRKDLDEKANPEKSELLQRFFKTGEGEYGEGDVFIGVTVPEVREIAKKYSHLSLLKIQELLKSKIHEERLCALLILVYKYNKYPEDAFNFYLKNTKYINNWDLVDLTAHKIVGKFLFDKDKGLLYEFVRSENLWERRIAVVSTFAFINKEEFQDSLAIAELLLDDRHDLIHKAVGWMLREIGKKDVEVLRGFLREHYKKMPRTMLRYSIEKLPEDERKKWLKGKF